MEGSARGRRGGRESDLGAKPANRVEGIGSRGVFRGWEDLPRIRSREPYGRQANAGADSRTRVLVSAHRRPLGRARANGAVHPTLSFALQGKVIQASVRFYFYATATTE